MQRTIGCLVVLSIVTSLGCGDSATPAFPVSGKVTLDGNPLEGATVTFNFLGEGVATKPRGVTDAEGNYKLEYISGEKTYDGAPAGKYWVAIVKVEKGEAVEADDESAEGTMKEYAQTETGLPPEQESLIPVGYRSKTGSPFQEVTVEENKDGQTIATFELKSDYAKN